MKTLGIALTALAAGLASFQQPVVPPVISVPAGADAVEQKAQGTKPAAVLAESFDGLGVGFSGPQGTGRGGNPSDNSLAVGTGSRRPDREFADGDFHEEGQEVRRDRQGAVRPGEHQQRLQGLRRHMRGAQQRRRGRPVRPAGRPLADRDADLSAAPRSVPISQGPGRAAIPRSSARRACRVSRAAATMLFQPPPPPPPPPPTRPASPRSRRAARAPDARTGSAAAAGAVFDVLRAERRPRSVRAVLPIRIPAAALPGLPAAGRSGSTATTTPRAPATTGSRKRSRPKNTPVWSTARGCSRVSPPRSSASSSTTSTS